MDLAERLTLLRKENGISQLELAEKLGVSRQAVSRWETGASIPSMDKLISLSKLYGVSMAYLIGEEDTLQKNDIVTNASTEQKEPEKRKGYKLSTRKIFILVICFVLLLVIAVVTYGRKQSGVVSTSELPTDIVNLDDMETFALDSLVEE